MGCDIVYDNEIKNSKNIYEFMERLESNLYSLNTEIRKLTNKSKDIYNLGRKISKLNEELLDIMKKIDTYDLMSTNWEEIRNSCHITFEYYYISFSSINSTPSKEEEEIDREFINAEKLLKLKRKELKALHKN